MLGAAPAIMSYILLDNTAMAITLGVVAVLLAGGVYILALLTHWRIIPRIVDILGTILTPVYIIIAIWLWWPK